MARESSLRRGNRARFETFLIIAGLAASALLLQHKDRYDGHVRFEALSALLSAGHLVSMRYSLLGPLFATPLWLIGKVAGDPMWWVLRFNTVVLAFGMLVLYRLLRERVDGGLLRKFFLLLVIGSMFANHVLFFYGEVFTSVLVAVGCAAVVVGPRLRGWVAVLLGVVNVPATIAGLVTLTAGEVLRTRRLRYVAVVVVAGALLLYANTVQRGSPFDTGYADVVGAKTIMPYSGEPGLSNPVFFGVLSLLFAPGKGLLFFAAGLFLPVRRFLDDGKVFAIHRAWLTFLVGIVLVYAAFWAWHGAWFWGPRYLLFAAVPASFALAVRLHRPAAGWPGNLVTLGVLVLSLWVGIEGAVYGDDALFPICSGNPDYEVALCYNTPEFSPLWYPFRAWPPLSAGHVVYLGYAVVVSLYLVVPLAFATVHQIRQALRDRERAVSGSGS